MKKKIIIIGSGFGGLAIACRLAAKGHVVDIFEKCDRPGGNASGFEMNGFLFDSGPTILTLPFMLDELFSALGKRRDDYIQLIPLNPQYQIFNADKQEFIFSGDEGFLLEQINRWNPADKIGYQQYMEKTRMMFNKWFPKAEMGIQTPLDMLGIFPDMLMPNTNSNLYDFISQYFRHNFLRQVFSINSIFMGGNPFTTSSIYSLMHHAEHEWGVCYPMGGMSRLVKIIVSLFEELGGRLHLNDEVIEILHQHQQITGVRLSNGRIHNGDYIISNVDPSYTYKSLLPMYSKKTFMVQRLKKLRFGMSAFIIYFGTRKRYINKGISHHNIILGPRYKDLFDDIFTGKDLASDFIVYLHMPTYTDATIAPADHELFYALVPVPNLQADIDWSKAGRPYRDQIIKFLENNYLPDLRANIVAEHYIDPTYFLHEHNSSLGAPYSYQPLINQMGWFRPHSHSPIFNNLFFVGSGTHPGTGIPAILASAKNVEDMILGNR